MRGPPIFSLLLAAHPISSQQIWDIWQTTWDRSKLLTSLAPSTPINFTTPGAIGDANIVVTDSSLFQTIAGFGASLTDSSALVLNNLKSKNSANYNNLLKYMFNSVDGANAAGLNYIRVPIGASDFSDSAYSLDDISGDTSFSSFNIDRAPSYLFSVLKDIKAVNSNIKVHILPWSPPAWMKDSGTMNGGSLQSQYVSSYPTYLLKAVQGFQAKGIPVYAISIQVIISPFPSIRVSHPFAKNEPQNSNPTYPTAKMTPAVEGQIGTVLRTLLNDNGLSAVKVVGYEHNWDTAGAYPVQLMQAAGDSFAGAALHCYAGVVSGQDTFHNAYPSKEIYFTECTGTYGSDWWSDIKVLMWNLALDGSGNPKFPGTNSCGGAGCRPLVTVNSDGSYSFNQESIDRVSVYAMAQVSKATYPKDAGGPYGQRIGVSVGGNLSWALRVGAFVTQRTSSSDWLRYSLVVLNCKPFSQSNQFRADQQKGDDSASTSWNPVPVKTTIAFRGMQATYTFPVGVTTLWWFAPAQ
ncbi:hypothetical protein H0H87_008354 [Tephrocybe sp. NHM501043]|nr:hypothetical protein H0H87_008354 [Tephrocybe sp. NHM501043]